MERFAGRYLLLRRLGGNMGAVHLALDLSTSTECVLKRLRPDDTVTPDLLRDEFEMLTRVRHPAVVTVYELGFAPDGGPYYTMEYVPGATAAPVAGDWGRLAFIAAEVAHGLEALHAAGIVHGDLKPSNLLVVAGTDGAPTSVRVVDFGLGALRGRDPRHRGGTLGFAAPELMEQQPPSVASDLFALGATIHALVVGLPPAPSSRSRVASARHEASAVRLEEAGLPGPWVALVMRMMAASPAERPRDAHEVRRELERLHPRARRPLAERLATERVVGRERALARIERMLAQTTEDAVTMLTLAGEPGIGKSAVLGELAVRAALAQRPVHRLSAAECDAPLGLARALLLRWAADADAGEVVTRVGEGPDGPESAPPDAPDRARRLLESPALPAESDWPLLVDGAARWAAAIHRARGASPLVLIDDAERLDPASRALLRRIALHPAVRACRWIWAGREAAALDGPEALAAGVGEQVLLDAGRARRLVLGPLDPADLDRMAGDRLHRPAPAELVDFLWRRSGGHPGLAVQLLRLAAESGALHEDEAGLVADAAALDEIATPADFERSLLARLASSSGAARRAAAALAVMERPVQASALVAIAAQAAAVAHAFGGGVAEELGPHDVEAGLDELVAAGLATRDGADRIGLAPPGLAAPIASALAMDERRDIHRAALALPGLASADRFVHLRGAGEPVEAIATAMAALEEHPDERLAAAAAVLADTHASPHAAALHERTARLLIDRARHRDAVPHLERALAAAPDAPERPARWAMLATAITRSGRPEEAADVVARALAESPPAEARARLLVSDAARLSSTGRLDEARSVAEAALAHATRARDDGAVAVAALTTGGIRLMQGDPSGAAEMAEHAEAAAARAHDGLTSIRAQGLSATAAAALQDFETADRLFERAIAAARREGARAALEELLSGRAALLTETGRWREARDDHDEAARIALEDGRPRIAAFATANLAQDDGLTGRPERARRQARAALRLARAYQPRLEPFAYRSLAQAYRIGGQPRRAAAAARRALARAWQLGWDDELDWARIEYGRLQSSAQRWREAARTWRLAIEAPRSRPSVARVILLALDGRAALRSRDPHVDAATERLRECRAWLAEHHAPYAAAHALQLEAELALVGMAPDGVAIAARTLDAYDALPAPADRAAAALDFARLAITGDLAGPVDEWLSGVARSFERLGDHRRREQALALLVDRLQRHRDETPASSRGLIQSMSRLLDSLSDLGELTQRAMELAVEQLDAERGVLLLLDADGELRPVVEHGAMDAAIRDQAMTFSRRAVEHVKREGGPLLVRDAASEPETRSESVVHLGVHSIVCVPMYAGGKVVGAVYLDDTRRSAFNDADRGQLEGFAHLIAVAIEKGRGHDLVRRHNEALVGENLSLRREVGERFHPRNFIGASSAIQEVLAIVERAARFTNTVLLTGEPGTGKEMIARMLHHSSKRRLMPFVAVNCGAIADELLEAELFGIEPNTATGVRARDGKFVNAEGGTLFLDEIGDMPLHHQVALLTALSTFPFQITPVGGNRPIRADVRIIAATNRDLHRLIEEGQFRLDLFFRLNVLPIRMPPLRERKADIPALAHFFATQVAHKQEREVPRLSQDFLAAIVQSDWPGNVRELENYVEKVMALNTDGVLEPRPLPDDLVGKMPRGRGNRRLADAVAELESRMIREALERADGNQSRAARLLGMTEQSLRYRLRKYGTDAVRRNRRARRNRRHID